MEICLQEFYLVRSWNVQSQVGYQYHTQPSSKASVIIMEYGVTDYKSQRNTETGFSRHDGVVTFMNSVVMTECKRPTKDKAGQILEWIGEWVTHVTPLNADLMAIDDGWERECSCASGIWPVRDYSGPIRWFYTHVMWVALRAFLDEGQDKIEKIREKSETRVYE